MNTEQPLARDHPIHVAALDYALLYWHWPAVPHLVGSKPVRWPALLRTLSAEGLVDVRGVHVSFSKEQREKRVYLLVASYQSGCFVVETLTEQQFSSAHEEK